MPDDNNKLASNLCDLTDEDSCGESHCSKTCDASSYGAELSATSRSESQINSTESLSDCLARLQSVEDLSNERTATALTVIDALRVVNYPDAIALANKLHAENERLKAMLVECETALASCNGDGGGSCVFEQEYDEKIVSEVLTKLHAAGIGGK